ncbi:hypothetical protein A9R05_04930 [Burkholderia sp. KK1]|nr:hypothetical protein A9R05_04930 [Burkholderia sp. KK1]
MATPFVIDSRQGSFAMYFGTLVDRPRSERENWERDMDASRIEMPGRWRAFWCGAMRLFVRATRVGRARK